MPEEYIKRSDAVRVILGQDPDAHYPGWFAQQIKVIPAADVAPVVHGEWVYETDEDAIWRTKAICPACKCVVANNTHLTHEYGVKNFEKLHKFCPNCGAKMDGGK